MASRRTARATAISSPLVITAVVVQSGGRLSGGKAAPGNVHSAEDCEEPLLPEGPEGTPRQQKLGKEVVFRADPEGTPAFAKPEIYEALEKRGVKYAIRIPSNDSLGGTSASCRRGSVAIGSGPTRYGCG